VQEFVNRDEAALIEQGLRDEFAVGNQSSSWEVKINALFLAVRQRELSFTVWRWFRASNLDALYDLDIQLL
jgi:hypothetical protein